jgi:hypothetical protein
MGKNGKRAQKVPKAIPHAHALLQSLLVFFRVTPGDHAGNSVWGPADGLGRFWGLDEDGSERWRMAEGRDWVSPGGLRKWTGSGQLGASEEGEREDGI